MAWDLWPDQQAQQVPVDQQAQQVPVAQAINNMEIDLNAPNLDMQEVIINPIAAAGDGAGDFIEINDFIQNAIVEEEVIQLEQQMPDQPINLVQMAMQELNQPIPNLNLPIDHMIDDEEEIPLGQLLDEFMPEDHGAFDEDLEPAMNQVLNVDAVLLREELVPDPVLTQKLLYAKQGNLDTPFSVSNNLPGKQIKVDSQWAPFFAAMLLSPGNYAWAKSFSESQAWKFFSTNLRSSNILVPDSCPANQPPCFKICEIVDNPCHPQITEEASNLSISSLQAADNHSPMKSKAGKTPIVESEVRRSPRLKQSNKGFKPSSCSDRRCLTCSPTPLIFL